MELPPGFRFHPTDEELITHYLSNKVTDVTFNAVAIGEVDLNKCEPWDLPCRAKMGEKEWYFFCVRDRKYPTGLRTNRATECGYWKATGKDREIHRGQGKKSLLLVGMKKTLVFYRGRAPKGEKTNWVMHEYRLLEAGYYSVYNLPNSATSKDEWVICRVFKKSDSAAAAAEGKRSMLGIGSASHGDDDFDELGGSYNPLLLLPPLMDVANKLGSLPMEATETEPAAAHVTCFSIERAAAEQQQLEYSRVADYYFNTSTTPSFLPSASNSFVSDHVSPSPPYISKMNMRGLNFQHRSNTGDSSFVKLLQSDLCGLDYSHGCKAEKEMVMSNISQDTGLTTADINTDISSVLSNYNDTAKKSLEEVPCSSSGAAAPSSLQLEECLWSYRGVCLL